MELVLAHQTETLINVICDDQLSHIFDRRTLILKDENGLDPPKSGQGREIYDRKQIPIYTYQ